VDFKPENIEWPEKGKLLISDPLMDDPYFSRLVILLCEHNEEGSFGFILNKYVEMDLTEVMEDMPAISNRVSLGGPVENNQLFFLHTLGEKLPGSIKVAPGYYLGGSFDILKELLTKGEINESEVRFFVGYSGWGEDQLMEELNENSWYVSGINDLPLMDTTRDDLWSLAFKKMGGTYSVLANFPVDPSLN
jgi:putative transcriptional regulator